MIHLVLLAVALVATGLFDLWQRERSTARKVREQAAQLADENKKQRLALAAFFEVLEGDAGGLAARIDEHGKLAEAIQKSAPGLVRVEPEVPNWLNRHDRFWKALRAAAALNQ
jgi:uncharacterized protein YjcR